MAWRWGVVVLIVGYRALVEARIAGNCGLLVSNHSYGQIVGWHQDFDWLTYDYVWFWYGDTTISEAEPVKPER